MPEPAQQVGSVEQLWVYPVKSLGGTAVRTAQLTAGGLAGDRAWAVVEAGTGERVTVRTTPQLRDVVPTGDAATDRAALTVTISEVLGRPVRLAALAAAPDVAAVHVVSRTAIIRAAGGDVPPGCSAEDPRANLVLALAGEHDERAWVGRRLLVGGAVLELTRLPKHCLGIYADVLEPGNVAVGDPVLLG